MATGVTDFGLTAWLSSILGVTSPPSSYYVALTVGIPSIGMDGTILDSIEPLYGVGGRGGYARESYPSGPSNWNVISGYASNINPIDFGTVSADWGVVNHYALVDAATNGNMYGFGDFLSPQFVALNYQFIIPAGALTISLDTLTNTITV